MLSWKQQDNARGLSTENIQKLRQINNKRHDHILRKRYAKVVADRQMQPFKIFH